MEYLHAILQRNVQAGVGEQPRGRHAQGAAARGGRREDRGLVPYVTRVIKGRATSVSDAGFGKKVSNTISERLC